MKKRPPHIRLLDIELEGLIFEVSAELDAPDHPIVFVDVSGEDRLTLQKFIISPDGLIRISDALKQASADCQKRYKNYWKNTPK